MAITDEKKKDKRGKGQKQSPLKVVYQYLTATAEVCLIGLVRLLVSTALLTAQCEDATYVYTTGPRTIVDVDAFQSIDIR